MPLSSSGASTLSGGTVSTGGAASPHPASLPLPRSEARGPNRGGWLPRVLVLPGLGAGLLGCEEAASLPELAAPTPLDELRTLPPDTLVSGIRDVALDEGGHLRVLNERAPFVLRYDTAGRRVAAFGREGGGPEEMRAPVRFLEVEVGAGGGSGPRVGIWDAGRRMISTHGPDGRLLGTEPLDAPRTGRILSGFERTSFTDLFGLERADSAFWTASYRGQVLRGSGDVARSVVLRQTGEGEVLDTLLDFTEPPFGRPGAR